MFIFYVYVHFPFLQYTMENVLCHKLFLLEVRAYMRKILSTRDVNVYI